MGMTVRRGNGREWEWVLVDVALEATGLWMMREYVRRRQAKIAEYIAGRPMYKQCTGVDRIKVSSRFLIWWDQ